MERWELIRKYVLSKDSYIKNSWSTGHLHWLRSQRTMTQRGLKAESGNPNPTWWKFPKWKSHGRLALFQPSDCRRLTFHPRSEATRTHHFRLAVINVQPWESLERIFMLLEQLDELLQLWSIVMYSIELELGHKEEKGESTVKPTSAAIPQTTFVFIDWFSHMPSLGLAFPTTKSSELPRCMLAPGKCNLIQVEQDRCFQHASTSWRADDFSNISFITIWDCPSWEDRWLSDDGSHSTSIP